MVDVPHDLSSAAGSVINPVHLADNFSTLEGAAANLDNSALAANAGITADRIADRFVIVSDTVNLVPITSGTDLGAVAEFTTPSSTTSLFQVNVTQPAGIDCYLAEIEFYVHAITTVSSSSPTISIFLEGTQVGDTLTVTADAQFWRIRTNSPTTQPFLPVVDADTLDVRFGRSSTGAATIAGVWMRLVWKPRLTA